MSAPGSVSIRSRLSHYKTRVHSGSTGLASRRYTGSIASRLPPPDRTTVSFSGTNPSTNENAASEGPDRGGKYVLLRDLDRRDVVVVYQALDTLLQRWVALKATSTRSTPRNTFYSSAASSTKVRRPKRMLAQCQKPIVDPRHHRPDITPGVRRDSRAFACQDTRAPLPVREGDAARS